jgi:hypothetical protein
MGKVMRGQVTFLLIVSSCLLILPTASARAATACGSGVAKLDTVSTYYSLLNQGRYSQAFACYSARFRGQTSFQAWRKGYTDTLHTQLTTPAKLLADGNVAVSVLATDRKAGSRLYSSFSGTWTLVQENGWRLAGASIHLGTRQAGPSLAFADPLLAHLSKIAAKTRMELPAALPFSAKGVSWETQPIQGGFTIVLGHGAPISDANTLFTETVTSAFVPTPGVDKTITLLNGSKAYYYAPFNHGGNGEPDLEWSQDHIAYQITYACGTNCLNRLSTIADSLQPFFPIPS